MAVTENSYTGNGSTTNYSFTFPYLKSTDVQVQVDATVTTAWSFANATTVQFNTAPANGAKIKILRDTNVDSLAATFYAGSSIKSEDLNDNYTQNLYKTQEVGNRYFSNTGGTMTGDLTFGEDVTLTFEGATDNAHETKLTVADPTADRTITLPDVTGTVVTTGDTGTVATAMIADDAITHAKMANNSVNSNQIVNGAVGTAEISDGTVTTAKITDNNVTTAKIVDANITTAKIADDAVTNAKLANDSVGNDQLRDQCVGTSEIANANITTAKIANDAVTADKLANTSVTAGSYSAADITVDAQGRVTAASSGAIATSEITNGAVTTAKLGADSVTGAKIADDQINSEHYVDGSIDTAHIADAQITTAKIVDANVTHSKLANDAVDGDNIVDNAINSEHYVDGSIDHVHLANDVIDGDNIQDNVINSEHYVDGSIDTAHIANLQVTRDKIANDAVNAAKIADDSIDSEHYVDGSIDTAHLGNTQVTDAKLASNAVTTSKITDANVTTDKIANDAITIGKIGCEQTTISDSDSHIPTSGAVVDYVAAQIAPIGGLEVIATEVAFPNTQPQAGVVISIADAGGIVVNGSGTSTTGRTVGGSTVTINNINSAFNSSTVDAGVSFMVSSTGSGQVYNFHKATLKEADILNLSNDINDFGNRYRVASSAPTSSLDNGDLWFDTTNGKMMVYNATNTAWEEVSAIGSFNINTLSSSGNTGGGSATFNGTAYRFTLSNPPQDAQQLLVSINGVIQKPNTGSSQPSEGFAISGNDIIFSAAPASGSTSFIITLGQSVQIGSPSDGSVTTAKLVSGAVTTAKIADDAVTGAKIATNLDLPDNNKIRFGTGNDLKIFHDGGNSYIQDTGTGSLRVTGDSIILLDNTNSEKFIEATANGSVDLYYDSSKKFFTVSNGVQATNRIIVGEGTAQRGLLSGDANSVSVGSISDIPLNFNRNSATKARIDGNNFQITNDNGKIQLGASQDLQIYHDGSFNFIRSENGHPVNIIKSTTENIAKFIPDGAVELYYDNSKKFETLSNGAAVPSGNFFVGKTSTSYATDGIRADGEGILIASRTSTSTNLATANGASLSLCNPSATDNCFSNIGGYNSNSLVTSQINFVNTNISNRHGAIAFMVHNGSTMPEMMRVQHNGRLGIGTTAPVEKLHVAGNIINTESVSGTGDSGIQIGNGHRLGFDQSGTRSWSIKATGGVLKIDSGDGGSAPQVRGILFGSDTADANKLDDYEEGYWSPTAVDGKSLTNTSGSSNHASRRYVRIGNKVTAWFSVNWDSSNSSANFATRFGGLPFSPQGSSHGVAAVCIGYFTGSETDMLVGHIQQSTGLVIFYENGDSMYSYSESAGDRIDGYVTYFAA